MVCAPSLVPQKSGDRVKTDQCDARKLARCFSNGDLTAVYVPHEEDEAIRDLCRLRTSIRKDLTSAKLRLKSFLLRYGKPYPTSNQWGPPFFKWLAGVRFEQPAHYMALEEMKQSLEEGQARQIRIEKYLREALELWRMKPVIEAL